MLERYKSKSATHDPDAAERRAAHEEVARARAARMAEREATRTAEEARTAAEREASHTAERERLEAEMVDAGTREADRLVQQKAARDARYAARKARK